MQLSVVLSTNPTRFDAVAFKSDFQENIAQIAKMGYDGVELAVRDPSLLDVTAVERTIASHNLQVPAIGTGQAYGEEKLSFTDGDEAVREMSIARVKEHIRFAAHFNAVVIVGLIRGIMQPGVAHSQATKWLVEALRECCGEAARHSVRLAVEPISRAETNLINTIEEGIWLLDEVGAGTDVLGLLPDTYHMNIEEPSLIDSLRQAGPRIIHFHVADSNRWYPGAGDLDFVHILSVLRNELGYDGWISAEILAEPDATTAAAKALNHLQTCLQQSTITNPLATGE